MDLGSSLELTTVLIGTIVLVLNVLDSVTTAIGLKQYPDKTLSGEGNPIMRFLMLRSRVLAEILKHGVVLIIVISGIVLNEIESLRIVSIMLGLVVINNSWIVISRGVTGRKVISPLRKLQKVLHIPDWGLYIITMGIVLGLAYLINMLVWRV